MADPKLVLSPKGKVTNLEVIIDKGEDSYALSIFDWEGKKTVGVRWNGGFDTPIGGPAIILKILPVMTLKGMFWYYKKHALSL